MSSQKFLLRVLFFGRCWMILYNESLDSFVSFDTDR